MTMINLNQGEYRLDSQMENPGLRNLSRAARMNNSSSWARSQGGKCPSSPAQHGLRFRGLKTLVASLYIK